MKATRRASHTRPIEESFPGEKLMENQAFYILVISMIANFIVLGTSINRPNSFFPVSLSALSISLQGYALRLIALNSIS